MRGKIIVFLLLFQVGLIGCHNSVSEIGSSLFVNNLFNINYVDSVTLKVSTILTDSLVTSNTGRLLVGYHEDEKLGAVTAKCIFQVGTNIPIRLGLHSTEYVSLRLFLKKDGYSYYDTTQTQTISVYQLSKDIRLNKGYLYNTSKFTIDSTPLGTLTFMPRPHHSDSLEIILPDALGQELMTMAQSADYRLATNANFINFFRGLALIPDSTSSRNMIGFKSLEMRLYYRYLTSASSNNKHVSFIVGPNAYFTNVHVNRNGTPLSTIKKKNEFVSSNLSDHEAYLQCGTGLGMRIEMPYLRNLLYNNRNFICSRALLELSPIKEFKSQSALPPVLYIFRVDGQNRLLTASPQGATLARDLELGQNTHYVADVTSFVNSQIQTDAFNINGLLILLDDKQYRSTFNRLYIGDQRSQFAMKIKLYFISLSNQ